MELRRLRLLYELSRLGTVASVAEALAYSPSSVSVQLAELEREAGTKLLRRVGRRVELTAAGHRLAVHAEQALGADEAVLEDPHARDRDLDLAETPPGRGSRRLVVEQLAQRPPARAVPLRPLC